MASVPAGHGDLFHDARNTARPTRGRFHYQDECVALRCVANLVYGGVTAVVVEWSTDYIAVLDDGPPELVSVKHRDPGQGDWQMSQLSRVVRDLHMVWRAMREQCRCVFASNAALTPDAVRKLATRLGDHLPADADAGEVVRFRGMLAMPDPPLPRRTEITAVGVRDMAGALSLLGRDERYAEKCYEALVERIVAVATERPDTPKQRIARLTGSMRAVDQGQRPRQAAQTLYLADLRELVLRTHDELAHRPARPITAATGPGRRPETYEDGPWRGGHRLRVRDHGYVVHDPVEVRQPPDGSYREQRAFARQTAPRQRDVRVVRLDVLGPGRAASQRRGQLAAEADLYAGLPDLPAVIQRAADGGRHTLVTALPSGRSLPALFGPPPYPATALDALLRALPAVERALGQLHGAGLAHRSLRPEVLFLAGDRLRLLDPGLATVPPAVGEGWPDYRAPEQERPAWQRPGAPTDVYQLAAVVYHLAVGQPPGLDPPPPGILRPGLSAQLDAALAASLISSPADRPSLADLVDGCAAVLRSGGTMPC